MLAKTIIAENNRKLCNYNKEAVKKMLDDVRANDSHIVPRFWEPSIVKLGTAGRVRKMTVSNTKDNMIAMEECIDIKARPSIKSNKVRPSIKQNKV